METKLFQFDLREYAICSLRWSCRLELLNVISGVSSEVRCTVKGEDVCMRKHWGRHFSLLSFLRFAFSNFQPNRITFARTHLLRFYFSWSAAPHSEVSRGAAVALRRLRAFSSGESWRGELRAVRPLCSGKFDIASGEEKKKKKKDAIWKSNFRNESENKQNLVYTKVDYNNNMNEC